MTQKWLPGPHPRVTQKWLKNGVQSHFWANFRSLWGHSGVGPWESLLGHFNSFWVSVDLGASWLHKFRCQMMEAFLCPVSNPPNVSIEPLRRFYLTPKKVLSNPKRFYRTHIWPLKRFYRTLAKGSSEPYHWGRNYYILSSESLLSHDGSLFVSRPNWK